MADRRVKRVTFIPTIKSIDDGYTYWKKVAAYARVSTGSEEQETSLEAQRMYYEQHIKENKEWVFAGIYYDDGVSGLSYRNREGFNRMIDDALNGKIDLILTKSLSRFARNTVDTLVIIRKLKEKGVGVYFEKEDIHTLDAKGEFLITLMSSLAQEESRSISENVAWGCRKRFSDGKYSMAYKSFLGYDKGADGKPAVNEEQAKAVRLIYWLYLVGFTEVAIIRKLHRLNETKKAGKEAWHVSIVSNILQNEKYKGDVLLQKSFTVDFLTKRRKINEGELPQYYLEKVHPAIVSDRAFDLVQSEMNRRKALKLTYSCMWPLASKIVCGDCGSFYGKKQMHRSSNQIRYYAEFWRCNRFYDNHCKTARPRVEVVQRCFRIALAEQYAKYAEVVEICERVASKVLKRDVSTNIRSVMDRLTNPECSIEHYALFQRLMIEQLLIEGEQSLTICFIDGNEYCFPLERNEKNRIIMKREVL